jgi:hypothetical protein
MPFRHHEVPQRARYTAGDDKGSSFGDGDVDGDGDGDVDVDVDGDGNGNGRTKS